MCAADFVNPVDWEPVGDTQWWMLLRCGACDTWREVTVPNAWPPASTSSSTAGWTC